VVGIHAEQDKRRTPKAGVAEEVPLPSTVPAVLATPGAALAALPRAGMEPVTEFRPGRALAGLPACIGPLAWIELVVVDEEDGEVPQDAPMTLAAAEISPDTGRDTPHRTPLAELRPLSETGASCACANAGAATPTARMAAEAAPPSRIRQLYTKHSISMW
jgi:hypothetical protein